MSKNSCHSKYVTDDSPIAEHEGDATHVVFLPGGPLAKLNEVFLEQKAVRAFQRSRFFKDYLAASSRLNQNRTLEIKSVTQ